MIIKIPFFTIRYLPDNLDHKVDFSSVSYKKKDTNNFIPLFF